MYSHAPPDYDCPFCRIARGSFGGGVATVQSDVVHRDADTVALVSRDQWPGTPGHVIVIPTRHFENLFDLPLEDATRIHALARRVGLAMKQAYRCAGISTRQHNEPAGNQDVWHYHLHVFPRQPGDGLYGSRRARMPADERRGYAEALRSALASL